MWTLDPIDGTKGFLRGGQYAVCLALLVDARVELGVIGCPNLPSIPAPPPLFTRCLHGRSRRTGNLGPGDLLYPVSDCSRDIKGGVTLRYLATRRDTTGGGIVP